MAEADPVGEEIILIGTLGLVLLLQFLTHVLQHATRNHRHMSDILNMMFRELMILGVVAFTLFLVTEYGASISAEDKHLFEKIHNG